MSTVNYNTKKRLSDVGTYESNLNDVTSNSRRNFGKNLYVASMAKITSADATNRSYGVELFPTFKSDTSTNGQEISVKALTQFWGITENSVSPELNVGDIVLVLFLDLDYKDSLEYMLTYDGDNPVIPTVENDILTHTKDYGIIIGKVEC